MKNSTLILVLVTAVAAGAGCNRPKTQAPPPAATSAPPATSPARATVTAVTLGKGVGPDKKVATATETFAPGDTIYASVDTQGTEPVSISARWTFQDGQTIEEQTQLVGTGGAATTEFHIAKPDGWPAGTYKVEILVDGVPARSATFRVG
jgi:hypothetical protein